jgi:hypothetical protein
MCYNEHTGSPARSGRCPRRWPAVGLFFPTLQHSIVTCGTPPDAPRAITGEIDDVPPGQIALDALVGV